MDGEVNAGLNLKLEPDYVSYTGIFAKNVWINMTASWYYNNSLIKSDDLYMFYHGEIYNPPDPGRWQFYVDFWFDNTNGSSVMGGRINAYEFPVHDDAAEWFRWLSSNWGVKDDVIKQSECLVPLETLDGTLIHSDQVQFVIIYEYLSVDDEDAGQYVAITDFSIFDTTLGGSPLQGIFTPPWDETVMPSMRDTGLIAAIWSLLQLMGADISNNIIFGGLNLWGNFVAFLDTIAAWLGAPNFFSNLFAQIGEAWGWFESSLVYAWDVVANIFILIGELLVVFVTTIADLIVSFVNFLGMFTEFIGGGLGAAADIWDALGLLTWLELAMILYPLYLVILWEERGMDAVIQQLTWIFGLLVWLKDFFIGIATFIITIITSIIESIPVAE